MQQKLPAGRRECNAPRDKTFLPEFETIFSTGLEVFQMSLKEKHEESRVPGNCGEVSIINGCQLV